MSLREFLAWWLRGLRATAVSLDEAMTGRRPRSLSDELERDIAELQALQSAHEPVLVPVPLTVSLEALWERPTVTHAQWARERGWVTVTNLETGEAVEIEPRQLTHVWRFDLDEQRRLRLANGGDR